MHAGATRPPANEQHPRDPYTSAGPSAAATGSARDSSGTAGVAAEASCASQQDPQSTSPIPEAPGDAWDAAQIDPESHPSADDVGWQGGFAGGDDWGDVPSDSAVDTLDAGVLLLASLCPVNLAAAGLCV